jgi:hypothetical protein
MGIFSFVALKEREDSKAGRNEAEEAGSRALVI